MKDEAEDMAGRLAGFILKQVPYYRMAEGGREKLRRSWSRIPLMQIIWRAAGF